MFPSDRLDLTATSVKSLCWRGDALVDWAAGGRTYHLDGRTTNGRYSYAYDFDAAVMSPSGGYAFLHTRRGTKGLVLDADGVLVREVNRSYYHAHVYEYPVALFALPDGREVMAHCPDAYNRLEIDLLSDGTRVTARDRAARARDFFHSRLAVSPGRTRLLSAGWIWHPVEMSTVFDLPAALRDPATLDGVGVGPPLEAEINSAAFAADDLLVVVSGKGADLFDDDPDQPDRPKLKPGSIGVFDLAAARYRSVAPLEDEAGTLMPLGPDHVVGFFDHPKVIEVATGRVVHRWPDLKTGRQNGSIIWHLDPPQPPIALDPQNRRFAVASESAITVIRVGSTSS